MTKPGDLKLKEIPQSRTRKILSRYLPLYQICYYRDKMDPPLMSQTASGKFLFLNHFSFKSLLLKGLKVFERKMVAALQRKHRRICGSLNRWWVGSLNAGGSNQIGNAQLIPFLVKRSGL